MTRRKSYYYIGLARKEIFNKKQHQHAPQADIVKDDVADAKRKKKLVKTIQWWAKPGEECIVDGPIDQMPFIKMHECFDEEGSVEGGIPTDYKVPVEVFICSELNETEVTENDEDDVVKQGAGRRGWSYQSTRPENEPTRFYIDFSPRDVDPLLAIGELDVDPGKRFYDVDFTILAETTGIGIDFWCVVYPDGRNSSNTRHKRANQRIVYSELFTDLLGVVQRSFLEDLGVGIEAGNGQNSEEGKDDNEGHANGDGSEDTLPPAPLFPNLFTQPGHGKRLADKPLSRRSKIRRGQASG
ncbi:hypothetical protein CJF30_00011048 [Rutstroemia sp. NJR-2017a BBW]|nr:hypothetical protein CJF30_00011048 [Rutstroemia sp. NJR-2017a BBW]